MPAGRDVGQDDRGRVAVPGAVEAPGDERPGGDRVGGRETAPPLDVERLPAGLDPPVQPHPLEVGLVRARTVPLTGDRLELPGAVLADRAGGLSDSVDPFGELVEVEPGARLAVEVEELRVVDLALLDRLRLLVEAFGDRALADFAGRADVEAPGVLEHPLLEVGDHRLVRVDLPRQHEPVGLVEALEGGACTVAAAGRVRERDGLAVGGAARGEPDDPLVRGVE
ncbi:hypothetical protein [Pimelobacter simplex]|uniref:hypothetical protein n=1 Tax=Nocardioides simplex TaxID=2045 RepID=UPI001C205C10|nr:hypothetical protein [Pimelobacter simplex]